MQRVLGLTIFSLGVIAPSVAPAQTPPRPQKGEAQTQYVKRYDFDNDDVVGTLLQPEGAIVHSRGKAKHPSLVQPRKSFLGEMIKSASDI